MKFWINLLGYQATWFAAVIGAAHGKTWPSLIVGGAFVLSQIMLADHPWVEVRLLAVAVVFGIVIDGVLSRTGWATYASSSLAVPAGGAPVWILVLWASFSTTFNRSLIYLRDRWWLSCVFGAIGAPLAYLGAQRGWQAVMFTPPAWRGVLWIAVCWAFALPLLATLAQRLSANARAALALPGAIKR